jgi:hypothetical protein
MLRTTEYKAIVIETAMELDRHLVSKNANPGGIEIGSPQGNVAMVSNQHQIIRRVCGCRSIVRHPL